MASPLRLFLFADPAATTLGLAAWDAVRATFEMAEQTMSRFREDSELTRLNRRAGEPVYGVPRLLRRALAAADRAHRRTVGRFDPRVLTDLERLGDRGASIAAGERRTPASGSARVLHLAGRDGPVRLDQPVDLGGIGKGLALRWAAGRAATALGPALDSGGGLLIDAGRDLVGRGRGPDGRWLVDVEDPAGQHDALAVVALPVDGAVATSSTLRRRWTAPDGSSVHHLIDPRTGLPGGEGLAAVTVAGPDPAWAEVWSKALFLEGAAGIAAAARREGLAAWWATSDGRFELTPAARPLTAWLASEAA
jgi:thiamine biosynthesis lipoprotein